MVKDLALAVKKAYKDGNGSKTAVSAKKKPKCHALERELGKIHLQGLKQWKIGFTIALYFLFARALK